MFQGNAVRDELGGAALLHALSSNPATMEGSRAVDAWGCVPRHVNTQSDAEQAYTQAKLGTVAPLKQGIGNGGNVPQRLETWVSLPPWLIPEEHRRKYRDPV